ncbi:MAG: B12-binding domain-containing radical SAM protein [Rhodoferax ferrireducens]|uniref:B12-binding domain-containing radical SAM protein n=2 Tax=Pseudomonadota TaxID=1224 RepID=A0A1Y1QZF1_9GAMM|nr:MAG: B12-binding domain-containing radical SAM protein [Rhodoferax ferrireducens]OQX17249.1 MAG: B12-binding domain-containing radical SAM protein [Thiothrix lacustris]
MAPLPCTAPRIILTTLNARYIHASLGLRYLLANLDRHGGAGLRSQAVLREYTISRLAQEVVADLLATLDGSPALPDDAPEQGADVVASAEAAGEVAGQQLASRSAFRQRQIIGFGVYIWNVPQTTEAIRLLKVMRPDLTVVLGGPEVSHETDQQAITGLADFVITGWGDMSFAKLCRALIDGPKPLMKVIPGEQPELADIELPYLEYSETDLAHRLLYVEASRGCPFKCEFCLSSLDKTAWAFALDRVLAALQALYQRGARNFKFVDRTFNLKIDHSARILQFFLDKLAADGGPLFLHFEVIPDHLPERLKLLLAQFPPGVLQLEVGVQSFNAVVQHTISRRQDNAATEANLRWLLTQSHAHIHADLIFGLPGETLQSFADGFDRLLGIGPHEIQLGILKRLRGTPITRHTQTHGMVYAFDPPYTVSQTGVVEAATLQRFTRFARYWDVLANSGRFAQTLALLLGSPSENPAVNARRVAADEPSGAPEAVTSGSGPSPFWRFWALSDALWQRLGATHRLTPEVLVDALFEYLSQSLPTDEVRQVLLADYLNSGARANPQALQGLLPRQMPSHAKAVRTLATRQERHQNTA